MISLQDKSHYTLNSIIVFIYFGLLFTFDNNFTLTALILFLTAIYGISKGVAKNISTPFFAPAWLLLVVILLTIKLIAQGSPSSSNLNLIVFFSCLIPIYYYLSVTGFSFKALTYGIYCSAIIGGFVALYDFYVSKNMIGDDIRSGATFTPQVFGTIGVIYTMFLTSKLVSLLQITKKSKKHLVELLVTVFAITCSILIVIFSGSRSPALSLLTTTAFFILFFRLYLQQKAIIAGVIIFLSMATFYFTVPNNTFNLRLKSAIATVLTEDHKDGELYTRFEIWKTGLVIAQLNPLIGISLEDKSIAIANAEVKRGTNLEIFTRNQEMHSDHIEVLVRYGLIGLLLYWSFLISNFARYFKANKLLKTEEKTLFYAHAISLLTFGITDVLAGYTIGAAVFFLPIIMFAAYINSIYLKINR